VPDSNGQVLWTDDQWNRIRRVVLEEARGARVAGNFLPLYGPLEPDASYVSREELKDPVFPGDQINTVPGLTVDDTKTLRLSTIEVKVFLRSEQVADPDLKSALIAFRRAANVLAHLEDEIIFRGQVGPGQGPGGTTNSTASGGHVVGGQTNRGLWCDGKPLTEAPASGYELVRHVSRAVGILESKYHLGPFACVLGRDYFEAVQTPNESLVLPQDRILPFLGGGPLVRSSALPDTSGLVVALGGAPIDLVVATDISAEFLQITSEAWSVFRVYEKIVLRINQETAIECFSAKARGKGRRKKSKP
jgi:uncharacterized linocin/CFP29 family protein